jgi:hypothetical protein
VKKSSLLKLAIGIFSLGMLSSLAVSTMAWFTISHNAEPTFNGSFVQYYFDEQSGNGYTADKPLIISKPIHLYNLSRLYKKGVFSTPRDYTITDSSSSVISSYTNTVPHFYFQLGKKNADGDYRFYASSSDSEQSTDATILSSTSLDMENYTTANGLTVTPIGQNFDSSSSSSSSSGSSSTDYSFKDHFIGNGLTISNLYVDATATEFKHAGFFGDVKDGANITSFNFDGLTIDGTDASTGTDMVVGLIAGYLDEGTSKAITLKKVGVRDGEIKGNEVTTSSYSLIGGGTAVADTDLTNGFGSSGGDVGVINITDIINGLDNNTLSLSTDFGGHVSSTSGGYDFDNGYYFPKTTNNGFGIFSLSAGNTNPTYGNLIEASKLTSDPFKEKKEVSLIEFIDFRTNTTNTTVYSVDLLTDGSSYNDTQLYFYENIKDKGGNRITSFNGGLWTPNKSVISAQSSCFSGGTSLSAYSNSMLFTTAKDNQDIIFITYRLSSYAGKASMELRGPKIEDKETGDYSHTYATAYYTAGSTPLKGSIFRTGKAGKYCICAPSVNGIAYVYVRVNGVSGGDFGNVSVGGIAVDFIATGATISTYDVNADNYSGAYFIINIGTAKTFVLYFRRVDVESPASITVTAYDASATALDAAELQAKGTHSVETTGSPPTS